MRTNTFTGMVTALLGVPMPDWFAFIQANFGTPAAARMHQFLAVWSSTREEPNKVEKPEPEEEVDSSPSNGEASMESTTASPMAEPSTSIETASDASEHPTEQLHPPPAPKKFRKPRSDSRRTRKVKYSSWKVVRKSRTIEGFTGMIPCSKEHLTHLRIPPTHIPKKEWQ